MRNAFVLSDPLTHGVCRMARNPHGFTAEASDLGFGPGSWPEQIPCNIGNGLPLIYQRATGEGAEYLQANGCVRLYVYND